MASKRFIPNRGLLFYAVSASPSLTGYMRGDVIYFCSGSDDHLIVGRQVKSNAAHNDTCAGKSYTFERRYFSFTPVGPEVVTALGIDINAEAAVLHKEKTT